MKQIGMKAPKAPDYFVQSELDRLRVCIGFSGAQKKLIMFTSSEPNEGKSYISTNIWSDLAKSGKRVCLLDCDMRKSDLRSTLQLSTGDEDFLGLTHYLSGQAELPDVVYSTEIPNAYIVPTATMVNPSFLLEENRFEDMLAVLRREFDYVIIDTPPLGLVSDGQRIASKVDACILVVRAHTTQRNYVRSSVAQLEQANCPLLGVVLNRVDQEKVKGRYSGGYYSRRYSYGRKYYYYYYTHQDKKDAGEKGGKGERRSLRDKAEREELPKTEQTGKAPRFGKRAAADFVLSDRKETEQIKEPKKQAAEEPKKADK